MCLFGMTVRNHGLLSKPPSKTPQQHPLCTSLAVCFMPYEPVERAFRQGPNQSSSDSSSVAWAHH